MIRRMASALALISIGAIAWPAGASTPLPTPGTAAQVAALVAASTSISSLPNDLVPSLAAAPNDKPNTYFKVTANGCSTLTACQFGDLSSTSVVVLYGDSHAQMWLPALAPIASADKFKLVLVWHSACPDIAVTVAWGVCTSFRKSSVAMIAAAHPSMVLLANKVTNVVGPGGKMFTNAQWESGQVATIRALSSTTTKVTVIGDVTQFNSPVPACLASYPTNVQKCSVYNPNPKYTQHFNAEKAAASIAGAAYVNTRPWLCEKKCSPVVGNMIVFSDQGHVADTYSEYLSGVWSTEITKLMG